MAPERSLTAVDLSIVIPAYNELQSIAKAIDSIIAELETLGSSFEVLVVDDGSTDGMTAWLQGSGAADQRIVVVVLSRNFGKESAMQAGLDAATGRAVVLIDADLQHPPELIPRMVQLWQQGYDVVNAVKANRGRESPLYRAFARLFNGLLARAVGRDSLQGASDFKLLDREVVEALLDCPERGRFLRGLVAWVGFRQVDVAFDVPARADGRSKWSLGALVTYTVKNLLAFSSLPLRLVALLGFVTVVAAVVMVVQTFAVYLSGAAVSGFTTVIVLLVVFSGVILASLGVIALYVAMIYEEQKGRPLYVIKRGPTAATSRQDTGSRDSHRVA